MNQIDYSMLTVLELGPAARYERIIDRKYPKEKRIFADACGTIP
jgi:lambda repressor-like predicted transcriptional regulator